MDDEIQNDFKKIKQNVKTLQLSTLTEEGKLFASYSPFVEDESGNFYIFISQLAGHTQNLLSHTQASILLIQAEADTRQIFARERLSYQCDVESVSIDSSNYELMLDSMENRFGSVMQLLRSLPDFILFKLQPYEGQYVKGFGKFQNFDSV